ncbi:hypothetical protein AB0N20_22490 [Streptomyces griseoincarnatus]
MPSPTRPDGRNCHAREEVNARIRVLMTEPASPARSEEWLRLLTRWVDARPNCPNCPGCTGQTAA